MGTSISDSQARRIEEDLPLTAKVIKKKVEELLPHNLVTVIRILQEQRIPFELVQLHQAGEHTMMLHIKED